MATEQKIFILTGPLQSGKTTSLISWSEKKANVFGVLTPVIEGRRVFMDAHTREQFRMEATAEEKEILPVGRFRFSIKYFQKAIAIIRSGMDKAGWLVIDEIGPLELKGEGFNEVLKEVLQKREQRVLLVARDGLVPAIREGFSLHDFIVVRGETELPE
jgi:nucleoside-triphosphatase THEP1